FPPPRFNIGAVVVGRLCAGLTCRFGRRSSASAAGSASKSRHSPMAYPELGMNACVTPPTLDAEITMLSRLAGTLANWGRALAGLRSRVPRNTGETRQAFIASQYVAGPVERLDDRPR